MNLIFFPSVFNNEISEIQKQVGLLNCVIKDLIDQREELELRIEKLQSQEGIWKRIYQVAKKKRIVIYNLIFLKVLEQTS